MSDQRAGIRCLAVVALIADVPEQLNSGNATLAEHVVRGLITWMNWHNAASTFGTEDIAGETVLEKMPVATQLICSFRILAQHRPSGGQL
ncbi:hypothetical protein [Mycobacterium aquaticum]|uniref:Uncharacterized protein n=1 Tax=Mycobacterium aquaticum TaxID=1927124 RepID=A0A1X0ASJ9_9MYCO|nr:hypothetical protein [Mycobacterium aquaticum]ORA32858.1 hypothetical protein BST13_21420 [Mycobacterium aquaticum]